MNRKLLFVFFSILLPGLLFAQTFRHPYSFYGIGELQDYNYTTSQSLGGLGYGWNDSSSFSNTNPASYSNIRTSIFDIGMKGKFQQLKQGQIDEVTNYISFSYIALGFPLNQKHNWGMSFGMSPISRIGYKNSSSFLADTSTIAVESLDRQGGFNKLFLGSSISIIKNLNLGVNVAYVFGNTTFDHSLLFNKNTSYLGVKNVLFKNYYGVGIDVGLQYNNSLKKDLQYTIGTAVSLPVNMKVRKEQTMNTFINYTSYLAYRDTIFADTVKENNLSIPLTFGIGGIIQKKNKWKAGFDFKYEMWSNFIPDNPNYSLSDQWSFALGGEIIPKFDEIKYFQRIAYRGGIRYTNSFLKVNGEQYKKMSAVVGFGFPISRSLSNINFAFEIGTMGKSSATLIKENFYNVYLSFRLNDIWFIKPKYY